MKTYQIALWLGLVVLLDVLFWHEKLGLNVLVFSPLCLGALVVLYPSALRSLPAVVCMAGTLISAGVVVWNGSFVGKLACVVSLVLSVVFSHQAYLRSLHYALAYLLAGMEGTLSAVLDWVARLPQKTGKHQQKVRLVWQYAKLALVPILGFLVFFIIFKVSNPIFSQLTDKAVTKIAHWIANFWQYTDALRLLFWVLGAFCLGVCVYDWRVGAFWNLHESNEQEYIKRTRYRTTLSLAYPVGVFALRNEYRTALMLMAMVNALLLVVNLIDIRYVWFGDSTSFQRLDLSSELHEGTYMLIFSILLSMGIMLYYFRRNLNFYAHNLWLKRLAYVWIAQNCVLVLSVALRAYYYVLFRGLAYKRIGVLIFLCLTLAGLVLLWFKIRDRKTSFFLLRTNGWALYVMLILMACVDWDMLIVQYNIAHYKQQTGNMKEIDTEFLLSRADKTLRLLVAEKDALPLTPDEKSHLRKRVWFFLQAQKGYTFWSWNYEEATTRAFLEKR